MKIKGCVFIIFALIFSTILPSFALASPLKTDVEPQENGDYKVDEVEKALEELGFRDVEVYEENNTRAISYVDEKGIEYAATYNLENEEFTFDSSDSSLSVAEKAEIVKIAPDVAGETGNLPVLEPSDELSTNVVVPEGSSWTYQGTRYGDSNNRDALIAAVSTLIVLSLPAGVAIFNKVKAVFGSLMVYIGWTRDITYYKTVIYTKHDAYTLQTRVEYYAYSDKARTKLKSSDTRYHTVQKKAIR